MKIRNILFALGVCLVFFFIAHHADEPQLTTDPNPMKQNQEQFTRIQSISKNP